MNTHVTVAQDTIYILWTVDGVTEVTALKRHEAQALHAQLSSALLSNAVREFTKLPPPAPGVPRRFA